MYILSGQTPYRTRRCVDIAQAVCGQNCSNRFHGDKQRGPFPLDSVSTNFNRWIGSGKSSERFTLAKQKTSLYQLIQSWDSDNRWWQLCWGNMVYNQLSVTKDEKTKQSGDRWRKNITVSTAWKIFSVESFIVTLKKFTKSIKINNLKKIK